MSAGVYKIEHLPTGRVYIGSSVNVHRRLKAHRSHCKLGTHANKHLMSAWSKYGAEQFTLSPLLFCAESMLLFYEQRAIDAYKSAEDAFGFNKRKEAQSNKGLTCSDAQKEAISAVHRDPERSRPRREAHAAWAKENKQKLSDAMKALRPSFEERRVASSRIATSARWKGVPKPAEHLAKLQAGRAAYAARGKFHQAVFTDDDVVTVRNDPRSHRAIARERGIDKSTVSDVRNRRTYKHIP